MDIFCATRYYLEATLGTRRVSFCQAEHVLFICWSNVVVTSDEGL